MLFLPQHEHRSRPAAVLIVAILLAGGCGRELMPTPNICADPRRNLFQDVPPQHRSNRVPVLYATDRVPFQHKKRGLQYDVNRSQSLGFGTCMVEIGKNLSWEELVVQSRMRRRTRPLPLSVVGIDEKGRYPDAVNFRVVDGKPVVDEAAREKEKQANEALQALLSEHLAVVPIKEAYVYIHGVGNTFDYAAGTIAELWHFMGRQGVPVLYSWPAGYEEGIIQSYTHDRESGEFTVFHLKQFLRTLASCPDLQKMHLIAHSRGTDVIATALRELHIECTAAGKDTRSQLKLGTLVLAAADMDIEVTTQRISAEGLPLVPECSTVYTSEKDLAMKLADFLFGSLRRLGQLRGNDLTPEQQRMLAAITHLQFIDAKVSSGFIGHSYFYENPAVSSDLILLLRDRRKPGAENGRPLKKRDDGFWEIRDGYPVFNDESATK
ncbi:MAG TPA: alpha/beta hydrolase [Phycisphaerae bacterium]|nr:alpha/beta hydrolase [Phycisphaerae bacterium]